MRCVRSAVVPSASSCSSSIRIFCLACSSVFKRYSNSSGPLAGGSRASVRDSGGYYWRATYLARGGGPSPPRLAPRGENGEKGIQRNGPLSRDPYTGCHRGRLASEWEYVPVRTGERSR